MQLSSPVARYKTIAVVAFLLAIGTPGLIAKPLPEVRAEKVGMSSERLVRMSDLADRYVSEGKVAGMVTMVARQGKIVYIDTTGTRGADDPRPLKETDLFRIYSMSKPITAVAAMQLYEQGKFHLNDPVTKYVPELKGMMVRNDDGTLEEAKSEMTMHQLLTHTAGLGYGLDRRNDTEKMYAAAKLFDAKDLDEFAHRVGKLPLRYQPGTQWHYSVAVDITGLVVQRLSGMPFDKYLAKHIFEPLGMVDTFFEVPENKRDRFLPNHYYDRKADKLVTMQEGEGLVMSRYFNATLFSGGGGLVSTAMDYMRFAEAVRNGGALGKVRILGDKTVAYMSKNHLPGSISAGGSGENPNAVFSQRGMGFGLGFGVVTDPVMAGVLSSKGEYFWGGAAGTVFWIDPVEEVVVVGMIQLMGSPWDLRRDMKVGTYQAITD